MTSRASESAAADDDDDVPIETNFVVKHVPEIDIRPLGPTLVVVVVLLFVVFVVGEAGSETYSSLLSAVGVFSLLGLAIGLCWGVVLGLLFWGIRPVRDCLDSRCLLPLSAAAKYILPRRKQKKVIPSSGKAWEVSSTGMY